MQVSLKWIQELINLESISLTMLMDKLTLGGFEVEKILEIQLDHESQLVLEISATANRSDSLSIQGISKEIRTLLKHSTTVSEYTSQTNPWKYEIHPVCQRLSKLSNCSFFLAVSIENVTNHRIPNWMQQKLLASNMILTNTLVDLKNYILLETGYPLEYYDFEKICSKLDSKNLTFSLSKGHKDELFHDRNESLSILDSSTMVVRANQFPISIAGIIENRETCYSRETTCLLVEASLFDTKKIRQQSRQLGLRTERSTRYEKALQPDYLPEALYRFLCLLKVFNPNVRYQLHTFGQIQTTPIQTIVLRYETVQEVLGLVNPKNPNALATFLTPEVITMYLQYLNCSVFYDEYSFIWKVTVPTVRNEDITREIDLIEEIGRLHGFNNFLSALPNIAKIGQEDVSYITRKKLTSCLLNFGLNELIHYSLVKKTTFLNNDISLLNPLLSDASSLRSSLLPNLIQNLQENVQQGNPSLEGFEYGHVFFRDSLNQIQEKESVAGIFGGVKKKLTWSDSDQSLTWYQAKGKIEQLFQQLNIVIGWKSNIDSQNSLWHPYRTSEIFLQNHQKIGKFGQIHPILASQLGISPSIYLFEFDLEKILQVLPLLKLNTYQNYSLYPKVVKDLSFLITHTVSFQEIETVLYSNGTQFLSQIRIIDEYRGPSIPPNYKSLCLQLTFQSFQNTLENKTIEKILQQLQTILVVHFQATIRT